MTLNIAACSRCGVEHQQVRFSELTNHEAYAWWGMCPTTNQPLLVRSADVNPADGVITYSVVT